MAKQKYRFKKREFLNSDPVARAYVIAAVPDSSDIVEKAKPGAHIYTDVTFSLSDCSKQIYLDFDLASATNRRSSLRKIDKIFETVMAFREALYEEAALFEEKLNHRGRKKGRRVKGSAPSRPYRDLID